MDPAVLARAVQYGAVAIVGGSSLALAGAPGPNWPRWLVPVAAAAGVLGVLGWLAAQAVAIADLSALPSVALETGFGRAALVRIALLLAALLLVLRTAPPWRALAVLGGLAAASFAWTGHGSVDEGATGAVHLAADILHLVAATAWLGALPVLLLAALASAQDTADQLRRFSAIGPLLVAVVVITGAVNSWLLVGPAAIPRLLDSLYGQLLAAKLALFVLMLGLAAANRWTFTRTAERSGATAGLKASLLAETLAGAGVLALVAWMGTLPPPAHG